MNEEELNLYLATATAKALGDTGVEGDYASVSCSTKGDRPAIGVSQWEYGRADNLLEMIGGEAVKFVGKTYSEICGDNELGELIEILSSEKGVQAQLELLALDTYRYVELLRPLFENSDCLVYAATWCPTSEGSVYTVVKNRISWGYDVNDLFTMYQIFRDEYAYAVGCDDYADGYANRAEIMYEYLLDEPVWG